VVSLELGAGAGGVGSIGEPRSGAGRETAVGANGLTGETAGAPAAASGEADTLAAVTAGKAEPASLMLAKEPAVATGSDRPEGGLSQSSKGD
jgi:hypothetical protein